MEEVSACKHNKKKLEKMKLENTVVMTAMIRFLVYLERRVIRP